MPDKGLLSTMYKEFSELNQRKTNPLEKKIWRKFPGPWLELHAFIAKSPRSIPGRGTKIPQVVGNGQKKQSNRFLHF